MQKYFRWCFGSDKKFLKLLLRLTDLYIRRKLTARNLKSPQDDGSHEDNSCVKIGLRIKNEFGAWNFMTQQK